MRTGGVAYYFHHFWSRKSMTLIPFNPKRDLMNFPVISTSSRELPTFFFRMSIIVLLIFFIGFFIMEAFSFIRLFEVTVVANPAMYLIK